MSRRVRNVLIGVSLLGLAVTYLFVLHHETSQGKPSQVGAMLAFLPIGASAFWFAWQSRRRQLLVTLCVLGVALLFSAREWLSNHFAYVELAQHAGTFGALAALFGRTLGAGRTPMVSLFARTVHGELGPDLAHYTRQVTLVWTLVFAAMSVSSLLLFFSGQLVVWSLLANILTPIIVAAVFLIEYLVRRRVLPEEQRTGLVASLRAAWPALEQLADEKPETPGSASPGVQRYP